MMGYTNANKLLPYALLREVQRYVDGAYLYVPRKSGEKRAWGGGTGIRETLLARNREIVAKRRAGRTIADLSAEYFLSDKTIARIVASAKRA
jgi:Mor family transcriptional regulator